MSRATLGLAIGLLLGQGVFTGLGGPYRLVGGGEHLARAEPLTEAEIAKLSAAEQRVSAATRALDRAKLEVAEAHKMHAERYMEWSTRVAFDGAFILFYASSMGYYAMDPATECLNVDAGPTTYCERPDAGTGESP